MDIKQLKANLPSTPAFVLDEDQLLANLTELKTIKQQAACKVLYSVKALPLVWFMNLTKGYLDGFSVSSLFEARLAKEIAGDERSIHITTPGLRDEEFLEISQLCSHISFNSINQYQRLTNTAGHSSLGLRLNPGRSFANDLRYDPCRPNSKLGIQISSLKTVPDNIEGLHFHNVFSRTDYLSLDETVAHLKKVLRFNLSDFKWINLGGGYLYHQINNHQTLIDLIQQLIIEYKLEVFIEPGKALVGNAGFIVSTIIDCFDSDDLQVCVLDTSVNHNPEVFEYQRKPDLLEHNNEGQYPCLLAGSSCLGGDLFGEYRFDTIPEVGDRLVFANVGAYSLVKASRFNGYNFPDLYSVDKLGDIKLINSSHYQDFGKQWGNNESNINDR
ncbi:MAG: carboxynorspermidine decarboxylase [Methylococcales symbiont of Hymedesmia sp. n. MRB-2018]|nr:MAG: carboxynorspermidine decarboxylase [Methylococcales symbiont of Hymedesmia sp. n. MRB-2018]KAF3983079.1 MAG: carboxynorspermidine decarboxylase [Methylococcales symbiont of Hymedesmia sp. n. MRB-2018]